MNFKAFNHAARTQHSYCNLHNKTFNTQRPEILDSNVNAVRFIVFHGRQRTFHVASQTMQRMASRSRRSYPMSTRAASNNNSRTIHGKSRVHYTTVIGQACLKEFA